MAVLKEIYIYVEIPQRQVNKLLHLQEQRENLILSWHDSFYNCGDSDSDIMVCNQQQ